VIVSSREGDKIDETKMQLMMCRRKQMKKTLILALVATLGLTGAAFAQSSRSLRQASPDATFTFGVGGAAAGPSTTNNDDSCDISVAPAATLLLPYFEVETATRATDTFFTITNVSRLPQIAHVTVWTDWSFPVLDFNIFLTGYDVQPLSLYDIIVTGVIAPGSGLGGTSSSTTPGSLSGSNSSNPNFAAVTNCSGLPGTYNSAVRAATQSALTTGIYNAPGFGSSCGSTRVGSDASTHTTATTAVGYVTVDVSSVCSTTLPTSAIYFASEILFDNTLIGDYQILNKAVGSNYAGGSPMVHIRAIPEGGPAGVLLTGQQTNLPYTFYARYVNGSTSFTGTAINADRRQPLPSVFAARWIQGGATNFNTNYRIWREGVTGPSSGTIGGVTATSCAGVVNNSALPVTEIVRFDEHENPSIFNPQRDVSPVTPVTLVLPETSNPSTSNTGIFPPTLSTPGDTDGWMYLNLNSGTTAGPANVALHPTIVRASQNWVIISMTGAGSSAGLFGVDFEAAWLGNGCSGAIAVSSANQSGGPAIGPVGGVPVCPLGDPGCTPGVAPYTGTNTTP